MKRNCWFIVVFPLIVALFSFKKDESVHIIPQPQTVKMGEGMFVLNANTEVHIDKEFFKDFAPYVSAKISEDVGLVLKPKSGTKGISTNFIVFEKVNNSAIENEGYQLAVSTRGIHVSAKDYAGFFNAFQTIRQLLPVEKSSSIDVPVLDIADNPRFGWRGMMLDVSRHFQTKEFILKQIDVLSAYKINKFHWHLTDDQGWRIEIKKYPNLTNKGAWRADRTGITWWDRVAATGTEPKTVGGFYTQQDVKEVIEYARLRNVEIIPEIDVPAHSKALIASYPFLFCRDSSNFEVATGGKAPDNALCAGKETTYQFMADVLKEVAALFPSQYIHIGGDECDKRNWLKCPHCQKTIKDNNLKDVEELQSFFIQKMNAIITKNGKKMIGWDEILSGKGAEGATIMAWRRGNHSPEIEAPKAGYPTIMASYLHSYISQVQGPNELEPEGPKGIVSLSKVYSYEPIPEELTLVEAKLVLGSETCLWAEFTPTESHTEYMIYPRALASAEVSWSLPEVKNWKRFQMAIESHFKRLKKEGVNYSTSLYSVYGSYAIDKLHNQAMLHLLTETNGYDIFYTTDGSVPTAKAIKYIGVVAVKPGATVKAALFDSEGKQLSEKETELKLK